MNELSADALIAGAEFEQLQVLKDPDIGLLGFVAIHSTRLGPAFGGIRRKEYEHPTEALADALRLAEHMSLKCAIQGIPGGGGKAVLDWRTDADRERVYRRLGEYVEAMGGRFYTGPDVGTSAADLRVVAEVTDRVTAPYDADHADAGPGDLGAATAAGVFAGIGAALRRLERDIAGAHVTVSGIGGVGGPLVEMLAAAGARLTVADIDPERVEYAVQTLGAEAVGPLRAHTVPCDVFAPCALGGVISAASLPEVGARAIAGAANNVLAEAACGAELHRRGVIYAPDFVINSGGLVQGSLFHLEGVRPEPARIAQIGDLLDGIFARSREEDRPPEVVAESIARERIAEAPNRIHLPARP